MLNLEMFDANLNNIINYINLRSDYDKINNYLYYVIDTNRKLNQSDINKKLDNVNYHAINCMAYLSAESTFRE